MSLLKTVTMLLVVHGVVVAVQGQSRTSEDQQADGRAFRKPKCPREGDAVYEEDTSIFLPGDECDTYRRCINGEPTSETCLDGLYYVANRTYPCGYAQEVDCSGQTAEELAAPRDPGVCQRDNEIFWSPQDGNECGSYTICAGGVGSVFECPDTLAFNTETLLCDYADQVTTCDAERLLDLTCEQTKFAEADVGLFSSIPAPGDCSRDFFICVNQPDGRVLPRPQSCPEFTAYDAETGECSDRPDELPGCEQLYSAEILEAVREHRKEKKSRRQARLLKVTEILGLK